MTTPMDNTGGDWRLAAFIHAFTAPWPIAVQTRPRTKQAAPYSGSRRPKTWKDTQAAEVVKRIIVAAVAAATSGSMPISSMSGPLTMPPPTPKRPANTPAIVQTSGYLMVVFASHLTALACVLVSFSAMRVLRKCAPKIMTHGMGANEMAQKLKEPQSTPRTDPWPLPLRTVSTTQPRKQATSVRIFLHGLEWSRKSTWSRPMSCCASLTSSSLR
mmetsp:Transcript_79231/g.183867  ORF Transcript_79231/g.183867 Transcript_79231/m.183867 type:complete len:215 (+) Transcript_79231:264-908(+)